MRSTATSKTRPKVSKRERVYGEQQLIRGLLKQLRKSDTIVLGGTRFTRDELVAILQERVDATAPVEAAWAAWRTLVMKERAVLTKTDEVVATLRRYLLAVYGSAAAGHFGIKAKR